MSEIGVHRERLLDHFRAFSQTQREGIARLWGASHASAEVLARHVYDSPDVIRGVVAKRLRGEEDALRLLADLALDHDILLDVGWASRRARNTLAELGLLAPAQRDGRPGEAQVPAAIAAVVSPIVGGIPNTLVTLLGQVDEDYVDRVAETWSVSGTTALEKILTLSEWLGSPDRVEDLADAMPNPEYLGAVLMALELGGICFWQEVFGHDLHENPEYGENVVALMRSDEREFERHIADTLMEFGLIFRIEEDDKAPLAVVPEEVWSTLWAIGRNWLMDWTAITIEDATDQAVRRGSDRPKVDLQATLKWFACEAERGSLLAPAGIVSSDSMEHLIGVGGYDAQFWGRRVDIAIEMSALRIRRSGHAVENPTFRRVLDLPRSSFVRQVLFDWCTGYVGFAADARLGHAIGLDDEWRREVVRFLRGREEFVPLWMQHEGVDQQTTGCGYIRNAGDSDPERLLMEIGLTNGLVWSAKLVWLDLLSFLADDLWYPTTMIAELAQIAAGLSTFGQLIHVLEQPNMGYYLPVQRASFLSDTFHTPEFETWLKEVVVGLFEPLGVGQLADDEASILLHTSALRIESPPGLPDEQREQLLREIFQDPELEFRVPTTSPNRLHRVEEPPTSDEIDLDLPLEVVRRWLGDRAIVGFDGRRILTS